MSILSLTNFMLKFLDVLTMTSLILYIEIFPTVQNPLESKAIDEINLLLCKSLKANKQYPFRVFLWNVHSKIVEFYLLLLKMENVHVVET